MSRKSRKEPEYWLQRAEQARAEASSAQDKTTRSLLVGCAGAYEALAKRAYQIRSICRSAKERGPKGAP
jgi:hypothetical protein